MTRLLILSAFVFATAGPAWAQRSPELSEGRPLSEALRALQDSGMRLVFSSKIVTPDMRVTAEPRATTPRARLEQLLASHGLVAVDGPGGVIQIVRATQTRRGSRPQPSPAPTTGTIRGRVLDTASGAPLHDAVVRLVGSRQSARTDLEGRFRFAGVRSGLQTLLISRNGYALAARPIAVAAGKVVTLTFELHRPDVTHRERVTVTPNRWDRRQRGGGQETRLSRRELTELGGLLTDDPMRAVHALPRVAATDDFRTEFSVRGSPYRHVGLVIDGVATPWLRHTDYGRGDVGSLGMIGGDLVEAATLQTGAYPQRDGNVLGAQLTLVLREGSRDDTRVRGVLSGTHTAVVVEGPLGGSGRGSWLVSARRSNPDWPRRPDGERSGAGFGFGDGLAKLVYDVSPTQQIAISMLGGRSTVDEGDDDAPHELPDGVNRTAVMNLAWRSTLGPATMVSQRFYVVGHRFLNQMQTGRAAGRGTHRQLAYRADLVRDVAGGVFEAGAQVERLDTSLSSSLEIALNPNWRRSPPAGDRIAASSWLRSGYTHFAWAALPRLTLAPGVRVAHSSSSPKPAVSPWLLAEWLLVPGWTLNARAGISHQFPGFELAGGGPVVGQLRPERATHVDLGLEQRLSRSTRWQVTFFAREEQDVLTQGTHPLFVGGTLAQPDRSGRLENRLRGAARGVELLLERRSATGLSGWVAYSFGKTRYTDAIDGESFWGNFDQRHAITLSGVYRVTEHTVLGVNLRGGSNFPIPGYLVARDSGLFVAHRRNETRLPAYVRLDARLSRSFTYARRRMSLFLEILNVLNRTNLGTANGVVLPETGEAVGFTRALSPRLPSVGLVVEF